MSELQPRPPLTKMMQAYRTQVEQLVETCLQRIRQYEVPDDAEPPAAIWPPQLRPLHD